jgi:hypothetical protein
MKKQTSYVSDGGNHFDTEREALVDDLRHKLTGGGTDNPAIAKAIAASLALNADWYTDTLGEIAAIDKANNASQAVPPYGFRSVPNTVESRVLSPGEQGYDHAQQPVPAVRQSWDDLQRREKFDGSSIAQPLT